MTIVHIISARMVPFAIVTNSVTPVPAHQATLANIVRRISMNASQIHVSMVTAQIWHMDIIVYVKMDTLERIAAEMLMIAILGMFQLYTGIVVSRFFTLSFSSFMWQSTMRKG